MSFEVYGDFDRFTATSDNGIKGTYQERKPCGSMLNVVMSIDNTCKPCPYRGKGYMDKFVEQLYN